MAVERAWSGLSGNRRKQKGEGEEELHDGGGMKMSLSNFAVVIAFLRVYRMWFGLLGIRALIFLLFILPS